MSMASVQLVGTTRDALLLSFKDAKLSVVEYDPGTHDLKILSLYFFEEPELRDGFVQNVHIPVVRVDPENRCAVMLVSGTQLVVLPFRKDTLTNEQEGIMGEGYIIDVRELDEKLLKIIDMKFLHGYYEPTTLILYEPNQMWPGCMAVRQDTCSIVAISPNIMQKVHPVIWSLSNLPFECMQVMAVPKWCSGVCRELISVPEPERPSTARPTGRRPFPCTPVEKGRERESDKQFQSNSEPDLEVVVCCGYGKNGTLFVLQRSIRPQVVTTFELAGYHEMWTVISSDEKLEKVKNMLILNYSRGDMKNNK